MVNKINIGDTVIVAENSKQTYRPDLIKVVVEDITNTPKTIKYHLSDGTKVMSSDKLWKVVTLKGE